MMALAVVADEAFDLPLLPFGGAGTAINWTEVALEVALILLAGIVFVSLVGRLESERRRMEKKVEQSTRELKDAQEELVRKEKLAIVGQLAGGVSHELRNPLGVISNAAYFLQMTLSEADETTREYLEMIGSEVRKAEKVVSDLLGFSRTRLAERQELAVSDLVEQVLETQTPPEGAKVDTEIAPDLPPVLVDPAQIWQVLANLVSNACQAMSEGGKLSINAQVAEGEPGSSPQSAVRCPTLAVASQRRTWRRSSSRCLPPGLAASGWGCLCLGAWWRPTVAASR